MEYLFRKGAVDLLLEIEAGPKTYSQLEQEIDVSSATLSKRLEEGQDLNLIYRRPAVDKDGNEALGYHTTLLGGLAVQRMRQRGLHKLIRKRREIEEEIEGIKMDVQNQVEELLEEYENSDVDSPDELIQSTEDMSDYEMTEYEFHIREQGAGSNR